MCTYLNEDTLTCRYLCVKLFGVEKNPHCHHTLLSDFRFIWVESCSTGIMLTWRGWIELNPSHYEDKGFSLKPC